MKDIFNKRQRFSIRKFSVGVASVLIGVSLFAPIQGVLASTENNLVTEIGANSERESSIPTVEKKEENQNSPENQGAISSPAPKDTPKDTPIGSTRTTELETSGNKENNSLTTRAFVAGEDRSSTSAVRAASNPSEIKKYELTKEDAKKIKAGVIGSEGNKLDSLLLNGPELSPEAYTDDDFLKDKEELYIYEKGGKKYVGYNSHPLLEDTDGDGIIDSDEKADEKLKWNVSERDMIMFMELSYRDDNYIDRVLDHKKPLRESELYKKKGETRPRYEYMMMHNELAPYWKRKKSYHTSRGLDAVLYETKSDFSYLPNGTAQVLAFRGTSDTKDIGADITLGLGSNPQQGIDAENIMRELANDKSITNLYLTGHSLGGYLVQRAMVEAYQLAYSDSRVMSPKDQRAYRNFYNNVLKKGTTFNAPKVRTGLFSSSAFWQKGLDSKNIAKSGKMTHYIVNNDSTIGKSVSNDSDVVINVGNTKGGHSSRSYFEADMINRRPEFISGKRISLDRIGFQNPKITTAKSLEKVGETVVYSKRGNDIIKLTTVSIKDPDTGQITKNTLDEVFKKDGAKAKVVVTPLDPSVRYEKDATRAKEEAKVTVSGTPGTSTVTTTYTVNPNNGEAIAHVGQPVVKQPAIETVVKVAAKDEVEYIKKGADVVKKTTSYTVNSKTGSLTSTEKEEVVNKGGAKDLVEYNSVEPKPVYLKDENSPKGTDTVQFPGKSGKTKVTTTYSVNPVNGTLTPSKSKPEVVTIPIARVVKVGAKDKVEVETIPSPVKYEKDISREKGQDNITVAGKDGSKTTTTTYTVNPNNGEAIAHVGNPVIVNPTETIVKVAAKDKVVETPIEPEVEYVKDVEENFGATSQRTEGKKGKTVTTTTYDVDPKDGHITEHVGNPVVTPAGKTIVKVGAKTKVERSKDDQGREVINTTTYEVDSKTGKVTPTTVTTYGTRKEATVEKKVVPSPVVYEKDDTKEKGTEAITVKGEDGEDTITTTYKVNPTTGEITPSVGKPVRTKEPTNTIVKVPAKDKVDVETIPSPVKYEKDTSREKGQDNITVPGKAGSKTTTTTYTVNPNNGEVTPNVGEPVIVKPTDTIIKVAAKDKVVYSKDGDNIVKEVTTYIVNPTNGNITGHTTKETFKENGLKDKVEVETIPSPVKYEKDTSREKGQDNITVPGKAGSKTTTTTYTLNPNSGEAIAHVGEPVIVNPTTTIVKVAAKDKVVTSKDGNNIVKTATSYTVNPDNGNIIEHTTKETFKENGLKDKVEVETIPSPVKYEKDASRDRGQENITVAGKDGSKTTTTTYTVNPDNGEVTPNVGNPVIVNPTETIVKVAAKDKVVETPIEPAVVYEKDDTRDFGTPAQRTEGEKGKAVTTTTYDVDPKDGHITEHVDNPVVTPAGKTIVKVGAKTKVERSKDDQGREVINTTTYEVDPKTGKVTPTTVTTYGTRKEATVEKRVVPSLVRYEKDDTKEKGTEVITVKGEDGEDTITTTYKVNPTTGEITPTVGKPVRTKEPTETVVKVPAKDKVVDTLIEPAVVYEKDDTRDFGTPAQRTEGEKGKTVTTTTYDVDPKDGHITEHVGHPVVTPAGKTVVKVGAKTKVEHSKDPEGRDVTDTTTYEVDPKTGKVTPTTVTTYGTSKEATVEKRVVPSSVRYEKDDTKEKGTEAITVKGEDGEDTITTTYKVNPTTGEITPSVGKPVRTKEPTNTVVKVAAKDKVVETPIEPEVEYVKDVEKDFGTPDERTEGEKGKAVTTTTYDVDPKNGHITAHVGTPVVSPAGKTIVKVGAKTKVEHSKDSEGRDVIDTTTYEVDPKTGKVTPTTVRTYGITKEPKVELEQNPKTGDVTVTPKKPDGSTYPPGTTVEIPGKGDKPITVTIGEDGKGKVPNSELPEGKVPGTGKITEPGKPSVEVPEVTTPAKVTPTVDLEQDPKTGDVTVTPKRPDGSIYPPGTVVEIPGKGDKPITVTIGEDGKGKVPNSELPDGKVTKPGKITEPDKPSVEVPEVTTPAKVTPTVDLEQDPKTGDVTVTPKRPDGSIYPPGTVVEIPGKGDKPITVTIGEDGKGKVPNSELPDGKVTKPGKITEPDKPSVEVPEVTTPAKVTPTVDLEQDPKTGDVTVTPKRPDGSIYPPGTVVEIPGKGDKPITVTIGEDGKGKVPNSELPDGKVTKPGKITEPGKPLVEVPEVTTPAKVTPTVDLEQDPKTGDVTVTPKRPDGSTYPPGTVVEIPGKGDKPITVTIGEDGKGKVPNSELPDGKVTKPGKITEPDKPSVEVPEVTTPAKVTPTVDLEQDPKTGDVTVTPKQPDGSIYPPGTVVEIPGKGDKPITVTIGEDGKGKVPNSELPDGEVTKPGKITEPGKPSVEVPEVTTPAKVTPTVDLEQDPKTGDVTVTPKRPDGSTYPPGTVVEIPGKGDKPITVTIGEDGKGKVPNSDLPEGKVSGPGKITEPNKPAVEVPKVETPGKVTPTDTNPVAPVTPDTPVKPDTNGGSGQDAPAPTPATPTPNAVTPNADQVDTKTTMDNGAKSNDSQNVLPNTGTESNATLASLGLLGLLSGFGLVARKKKED